MSAPILRPGRNHTGSARADRVAFLIDGHAYFSAFKRAVLAAREQILIIGWDIDSRVRLERRDPMPGVPDDLLGLLRHVAKARPKLQVRVLVWNFALLYAGGREPLPSVRFNWRTPANVRAEFDDALPMGGAQHQKIVVIDDRLAFVGGLDLTEGRWDTPEHSEGDPDRVDCRGTPYGPYHDVVAMFTGPAAALAGEICRARWQLATGQRLKAPPGTTPSDPWPDTVRPDVEDIDIAIARTQPPVDGAEEVREVEQLYLDAIAAAKHLIFIENQYLTSRSVIDALVARLEEPEGPEIVILNPARYDAWLESQTMGVARARAVIALRSADHHGRLLVLAPCLGHEGDLRYTIHAKMMTVDDRFLRIGSANLNNRSMSIDSECDIAIESDEPRVVRAIAAFRRRLIANHVGIDADELAGREIARGSLVKVLAELPPAARCLMPLDAQPADDAAVAAIVPFADPEQVPDVADLLARTAAGDVDHPGLRRLVRRAWKIIALVAALGLIAAVWRFTPLSELVDPDTVTAWFEAAERSRFAPLLTVAIYVLAGLVVFPVTVLIAATAVAFGPWLGLLYAAMGSLANAVALYVFGRAVGRRPLKRLLGRRMDRLERHLERSGVVSIFALRMLPIAPYSVVNVGAGAAQVKPWDYLAGTALGLAPGLVVMTAMGGQVRAIATESGPWRWVALVGLFLVWIALGWVLQRYSRKRALRKAGLDARRASAARGAAARPKGGFGGALRLGRRARA